MVPFTDMGKVGSVLGWRIKNFGHVNFEMHVKYVNYVDWAIEYLGLRT